MAGDLNDGQRRGHQLRQLLTPLVHRAANVAGRPAITISAAVRFSFGAIAELKTVSHLLPIAYGT